MKNLIVTMFALVMAIIPMQANAQTLQANQALMAGQQLYSSNGKYKLVMQASDGNLVVYRVTNNAVIWATNVFGGTGAVMQEDRNFVVYGNIANPATWRWASNTSAPVVDTAAYLQLGDDGALTIYSGAGQKVWGTSADPAETPVCPPGSLPGYYPICMFPNTPRQANVTAQALCWAEANQIAQDSSGGYAGYCH
ncbi:hypothetical protein [Corallococcus llansteffanensis]|uniref:Bulb-type lectin domain-containing protein n=1 Tax=Corallococcus llansteffanensis TaxID=2316731 RepID=A0A3A8NKN6_9BACT|nr:hypothetical protein [Corallococcus llansteffanensis]RKH44788.1 hypothetical protein D7V93_35945 [Corallococcus llansteffanensis]